MGLFSRKYVDSDDDGKTILLSREEKIQSLYDDFLKIGAHCSAILPETEVKRENPLTRAAATGILGLQGFALTEDREEYKVFSGIIRPVTKGLVISGRWSVSEKEIRIPWESLIKATEEGKNFSLKLIDGTSIRIEPEHVMKKFKEYRHMVIDYINSKASGVVEDGWDN